jgi:hypothetical protein
MPAAAAYNFKQVINQVLKNEKPFLFDFLNRLFAFYTQPTSLYF